MCTSSQMANLPFPNKCFLSSAFLKHIFEELEETTKLKKIRLSVFRSTCVYMLFNNKRALLY